MKFHSPSHVPVRRPGVPRKWRSGALAIAFAALASAANAQDGRDVIYGCLDNIGLSTTWAQCVNAMFSPCAGEELGTEAHAACLNGLYSTWFDGLESEVAATMQKLPQYGQEELTGILSAWYGFASTKCSEIAAGREGSAAQSAELGCQISETALLSNELRRCRAGRSQEAYCAGVSD